LAQWYTAAAPAHCALTRAGDDLDLFRQPGLAAAVDAAHPFALGVQMPGQRAAGRSRAENNVQIAFGVHSGLLIKQSSFIEQRSIEDIGWRHQQPK
jgi:hypothetical protein